MLTPPLLRQEIEQLVPHRGAMCLLDRAVLWDFSQILCETERHRDPGNPLRRDGLLPAVCGVEFALQAMALHGALTSGAPQPVGFVSSLRDLALHVDRLEDLADPLRIEAVALVAEASGFIYRFGISAGDRLLIEGQAAIIIQASA
ncbi:phosphotransferase [Roseococcus sp. YIM B11640]|uniref:phosphotransferase n=1 Tax=Roseococcus sp. YIM B11640 TaxID=3133973 RepID=UPI003C7E70A7